MSEEASRSMREAYRLLLSIADKHATEEEEMAKVPISDLVMDFEIYPRVDTSDIYIAELAEALRSGAVLPPVIADKASKRLVDGFHRVKAHTRVFGADGKITVQWRSYESEAELVSEAIRLNGKHGRRLSKVDCVRCAHIGNRSGLQIEAIASLLGLTTEKLTGLVASRSPSPNSDEVILRPDMAHLAGTRLTAAQKKIVARGGGNKATFYARRLAELLEAEALDLSSATLRTALERLRSVLSKIPFE